jgi:hypothetical protein
MIDLANNIKPRGYFRQSLWSKEPMLYIGSYPVKGNDGNLSIDAPNIWNYKNGEKIRVVCYTNTDKVALFLNGKKVGKTKKYDDKTGIIYWDVVFQKGTLKAVGYQDKNSKVITVLQTAEEPKSLRLSVKQANISFKNDVAVLEINALDIHGNLSKLATNEITCTVTGAGELLGIENASNNVAEDYTDNKHRLLNGKAVVYIRATENKGSIRVKIASSHLTTKYLDLKVN